MPDNRDALPPRPQLTRARWIDLGGAWGFAYDDVGRGLDEGWSEREDVYTRTITVPFPPESPASGLGETGFHPILWYRRTVQVPQQDAGQRLLLHCGAVDYQAQVWVNGHLVAMHEGGHTPFSADITSVLRPDADQVIVVRAEDVPGDLAQPRGKQDWEERPHRIWYHRTTGIWQPIWLEPVGATHLTGVRWAPDRARRALGLEAPSAEPLRREVALTKELGFNGVRVHQKVEDPRFLSWCDRLGLLVWGEMANAYVFPPLAVERLTCEWMDVLARDDSHPCIVAWVPLHESWGVPDVAHDPAQQHYVQALYHLTRALDPTRPAVDNEGWEHIVSDVYGIHDYAFDGALLRERYGSAEAVERTLRAGRPDRALSVRGYGEKDAAGVPTEFGGVRH